MDFFLKITGVFMDVINTISSYLIPQPIKISTAGDADPTDTSRTRNRLLSVINDSDIILQRLRFSPEEKIIHENYRYDYDRIFRGPKNFAFRCFIEFFSHRKDIMLEEYRTSKNYPSGKDVRPAFFSTRK